MPRRTALVVAVAAALSASAASGAPGDWVSAVRPVVAPRDAAGAPLPFTPAPGAPAVQEGWAANGAQRMLYNVAQPSLIALPFTRGAKPAAAVILAPGGGFEFLSMDNEGWQVAERLRPLGVRVFILKYRTLPLPGGFDGFKEAIASTFTDKPRPAGPIDIRADIPYAVADAQAAVRSVRADAAKWGVDPARVGLVGFSAGAVTALVMTQSAPKEARPDFVGLIYGPTAGPAPAGAPPLFAAIAADDRFFGKDDLSLLSNWRNAGASVELHLYAHGGHGFASQPSGATSDAWFDQFALWLRREGFASGGRG